MRKSLLPMTGHIVTVTSMNYTKLKGEGLSRYFDKEARRQLKIAESDWMEQDKFGNMVYDLCPEISPRTVWLGVYEEHGQVFFVDESFVQGGYEDSVLFSLDILPWKSKEFGPCVPVSTVYDNLSKKFTIYIPDAHMEMTWSKEFKTKQSMEKELKDLRECNSILEVGIILARKGWCL